MRLMEVRKGIVAFIVMLGCSGFVRGQDLLSSFTVHNGNGSRTNPKIITCDQDGFLWYSSNNSVVKFTGQDQIVYPLNVNFPIGKNDIVDISVIENTVFALAKKGLFILNLTTNQTDWHSFYYKNGEEYLKLRSLNYNFGKGLWIDTETDIVIRYDFETNDFEKFNLSASGKEEISNDNKFNQLKILNVTDSNAIIFRKENQIRRFDGERVTLVQDTFNRANKPNQRSYQESILVPNGSIFPKNYSGSFQYKNKKYQITYLEAIDSQLVNLPFSQRIYIENIQLFQKGIGHNASLVVANGLNLSVFQFEKRSKGFALIELSQHVLEEEVTNLFIDYYNNIWVHAGSKIVKVIVPDPIIDSFLVNNENTSCRDMFEDAEGSVVLASYKGLFVKRAKEGKFQKLKLAKSKEELQEKSSFLNRIYAFKKLSPHQVLALGHHCELAILDLKKEEYSFVLSEKVETKCIGEFYDAEYFNKQEALMYLASDRGLFVVDLKTGALRDYNKLPGGLSLKNTVIEDLFKDSRGNLWIATQGRGLIKVDRTANRTTHYKPKSTKFPLINSYVNVVFEDRDAAIWVGTAGGIQKVVAANETETDQFNTHFMDTNIVGILQDDEGMYWLSTFNGLVLFDGKKIVQSYYQEDGIANSEFNRNSSLKLSNGDLLFGTVNGGIRVNPQRAKEKKKREDSQLYLTKLSVDNFRVNSPEKLATLKDIEVDDEHSSLVFHFAINDLSHFDRVKYEYKIKGVHTRWNTLGKRGVLRLFSLPKGVHEIWVRGVNSGAFHTDVLKYRIVVSRPFYKEPWLGVIILVLIMILMVIRLRIKLRKRRVLFQLKKKLRNLESKSLKSQMNPHFLSNIINSVQGVMVLKGIEEASRYLSCFYTLLRYQLDSTNMDFISLGGELQYLKSYVYIEGQTLDKTITLHINCEERIKYFNIPPALLQPLVENSIHHGFKGNKEGNEITIDIRLCGKVLQIVVSDNGVGCSEKGQAENQTETKQHQSWATAILRERMEVYNVLYSQEKLFSIQYERGAISGTRVVLIVPFKH